jgi:hypothetical protein
MGRVGVRTKVQPCVLTTLPTKEFADVAGLEIGLDVERIEFVVTWAERGQGKHEWGIPLGRKLVYASIDLILALLGSDNSTIH